MHIRNGVPITKKKNRLEIVHGHIKIPARDMLSAKLMVHSHDIGRSPWSSLIMVNRLYVWEGIIVT